MLNYFYIIALKTLLELAPEAELELDRNKYLEEIERVSRDTENNFFMAKEKRIANSLDDDASEQLPAALALLLDDVPKEKSSRLPHALAILSEEYSEHLKEYIQAGLTDEKLLMPDCYFQFFIFQALKQIGNEAEILKNIRKYWGSMIETGTSTLWEAAVHKPGKQAFGGTGSLCHGFASAPVDFFQTVILGVTPVKPGFRTFSLNPHSLGLKFADGTIPTPHGSIKVKWKKSGNGLSVMLKIPENCKAITAKGGLESGHHELEIKEDFTARENSLLGETQIQR
jgi:hypothetical protein